MENEKTEFKQAKDQKMTLIGITLETSKDNLHVDRVRFVTERGDITYRPSITKEEFRDGFKVKSEETPLISELHPKIKDLARLVQAKGKQNLICNYTYMEEDQDGQPKTYRFINNVKILEEWRLVD